MKTCLLILSAAHGNLLTLTKKKVITQSNAVTRTMLLPSVSDSDSYHENLLKEKKKITVWTHFGCNLNPRATSTN